MSQSINVEFLQIIESVVREKNIPREAVVDAITSAVQVAGRRKYGHEHNIVAELDGKTGEIKLYRQLDIVEEIENYLTQISLEDAKLRNADAEIGGYILEPLPPIDLGRVAAQSAKQVIVQKIRDAERDKEYNEYIKRVGEIINGTVKRVERGDVIVDFGRTEAIIPRNSMIRGEQYKPKDRIRAYIEDVRRENKGPQIFLSRTADMFLAKLFEQEVPEIYDGVIKIHGVAREPGSRAKISVYSSDSNIDPIGSCVGVRGARVQSIISELQGEKIDIVVWSNDPATYVVNALSQAQVSKVVINEEKRLIEVVVPESQLSLAIGRRGQNVRLAAKLTGWNVDVLTEEVESKKRQEEFARSSALLMEALDVEDVLANLLVTEGFNSVEDVAYITLEDVAGIEGLDQDLIDELKSRAEIFLKEEDKKVTAELKNCSYEEELAALPLMTNKVLLKLCKNKITSVEALAKLPLEKAQNLLVGEGLAKEEIAKLIDSAKK